MKLPTLNENYGTLNESRKYFANHRVCFNLKTTGNLLERTGSHFLILWVEYFA